MGRNLWFTADLHVGHRNIIDYCGRPYTSVDDMTARLRDSWNERVAPDDDVWVLGDVAMGKRADTVPLLADFHGTKHLVAGNHDPCWGHGRDARKPQRFARSVELFRRAGFDRIVNGHTMRLGGRHVLLSHFPYAGDSHDTDRYIDARPVDRGAWLLHGHTHGAWRQQGRQIDVGVDAWGYRPVHADEIVEIMAAGPADREPLPA